MLVINADRKSGCGLMKTKSSVVEKHSILRDEPSSTLGRTVGAELTPMQATLVMNTGKTITMNTCGVRLWRKSISAR